MAAQRKCIYCGKQDTLTYEHVIPDALGGSRRFKSVCKSCNNTTLSQLDQELCQNSPLGVVAAFELCKKSRYAWDVDHQDNNLLLEASADEKAKSMTQWPQIVFDQDGPQLHGDAEEIQQFGWDNFQLMFCQQMLSAFRSVKSGAKRPRIIFERVTSTIPAIYRYPPRIFATRPIRDFDSRMRFQCRYRIPADKQRVLRELDNWNIGGRFRSYEVRIGSKLPAFNSRYELTSVFRALLKIAINLLYATCERTLVDRSTFAETIRLIKGGIPLPSRLLAANGFVPCDNISSLGCPPDSHCFRLLYDDRKKFWNVYQVFFGGRIGAFVRFPGPNADNWCTADVIAPINSPNWTFNFSRIFQPIRVGIEWLDIRRIAPSMPLLNTKSEVTVVAR